MRKYSRMMKRGFTLVELMIVVAIIGVLAALAIYGVRKYLANAKTAEAKNTIGAINRAAVAAYNRESAPAQLLSGGTSGSQTVHALCATANPVPNAIAAVANMKYQPNTTDGQDYNTATWKCLKFSLTEPQYYRYAYTKAAKTITTITTPAIPATGWACEAQGDLNGNGVYSGFMIAGDIVNGEPIKTTEIGEENPDD